METPGVSDPRDEGLGRGDMATMERLRNVTRYLGRKQKERERKRAKWYGLIAYALAVGVVVWFAVGVFHG